MNKVILTNARLVKELELKFSKASGVANISFSVAVKRAFKKDECDFINCKAFGKTAEMMATYLTKGTAFNIEGRIQTGSYDNKEGIRVYTTDVIVDRFEFIATNKKESYERDEMESCTDEVGDIFENGTGDIPF